MGSKARISKEISAILNKCILDNNVSHYVEPFVGGANMIQRIICENKYGLDSNKYLINMWKALQKGWVPPETLSKELYEKIRDNKDAYPDEMVAFAGLVATYNAKWFGGYAGIVHTKINTDMNYYDEARRNILDQLIYLKDVKFGIRNYQDLKISTVSNHVFYCDPPYQNSTKYKDDFNHEEFWNWIRAVSKNNFVFVSEYNAPNDFQSIWEKSLTTTLDKNSRKQDTEHLFIFTQ